MSGLSPRAVVVTRKTEYQGVLERHGTLQQARFSLEGKGVPVEVLRERHEKMNGALSTVLSAIPRDWRRTRVERSSLDRFLFEPEDIVVVVGQDGLVANVAKYLEGQPVLGVNPDPTQYDGVLVRHQPDAVRNTLKANLHAESRTMVKAELDDGLSIVAVNEVFLGHVTHQSARYSISWGGVTERHSSSGLIVATGTGATGWARSINLQRPAPLTLPCCCDPELAFFVREPFPSRATQTTITQAIVDSKACLTVRSEMSYGGVIFGDGIESDALPFDFGRTATISASSRPLNLVV